MLRTLYTSILFLLVSFLCTPVTGQIWLQHKSHVYLGAGPLQAFGPPTVSSGDFEAPTFTDGFRPGVQMDLSATRSLTKWLDLQVRGGIGMLFRRDSIFLDPYQRGRYMQIHGLGGLAIALPGFGQNKKQLNSCP